MKKITKSIIIITFSMLVLAACADKGPKIEIEMPDGGPDIELMQPTHDPVI